MDKGKFHFLLFPAPSPLLPLFRAHGDIIFIVCHFYYVIINDIIMRACLVAIHMKLLVSNVKIPGEEGGHNYQFYTKIPASLCTQSSREAGSAHSMDLRSFDTSQALLLSLHGHKAAPIIGAASLMITSGRPILE